jgi:lysophospholipase
MTLETAPLYPVEGAPEGLETVWLPGAAGKKFRAAFLAHPNARASLIVLPGRTECLEKYLEVVADFAARGLNVLLVEPRGQGLSDRLLADRSKGHMDSWANAVSDLATAVDAFADRMPGKRLLMAHSMGGAISLEALLSGKVIVDGAIFSAPMWGIRLPPGGDLLIKGMIATGFGENIVPGGAAKVGPEPFEGNALTSDPKRHARQNAIIVAHPELGLAGATATWVGSALELLAGFSPERLKALTIPVLVGSGSLEALVDNDAHTRIAGQLPKGRQIVIAGAKHELLMEADGLRDQFLSAVDGFIDGVLA